MNRTCLILMLAGAFFGCSDDSDDANDTAGAGTGGGPSETGFGATCDVSSDCVAPTDYCAAPPMQTKFCTKTLTSCDEAPTTCPEGWSCLDLNAFGIPVILCERPAGG